MRIVLGAIAVSAALVATEASAQGVNLTGPYQCIEGCVTARPGDFAFVTQNGWELNMVNEAGQASTSLGGLPGAHLDREGQSRRDLLPGWHGHSIRQRNHLEAWHRSCRLLRRPVAVAADIAARRDNRGPLEDAAEADVCSKLEGPNTARAGAWPFCFALSFASEPHFFHFRTSESLLPAQSAAAADAWKLRIATYLDGTDISGHIEFAKQPEASVQTGQQRGLNGDLPRVLNPLPAWHA